MCGGRHGLDDPFVYRLVVEPQFLFTVYFSERRGIGTGMSLPALDALITEGIENEECGTISSFYNSMRFIGVALGPPIFAALMSNAAWLIFILSAFFSLVSLFLVVFNIDSKESEEEDSLRTV